MASITRNTTGPWDGRASACGGVVRCPGVVTGASATSAGAGQSALGNDDADGAAPEWQATSPTWRISRRFLGLNDPADLPGPAASETRGGVVAGRRTVAAGGRGVSPVMGGEDSAGDGVTSWLFAAVEGPASPLGMGALDVDALAPFKVPALPR